jgi:hypothetical protein
MPACAQPAEIRAVRGSDQPREGDVATPDDLDIIVRTTSVAGCLLWTLCHRRHGRPGRLPRRLPHLARPASFWSTDTPLLWPRTISLDAGLNRSPSESAEPVPLELLTILRATGLRRSSVGRLKTARYDQITVWSRRKGSCGTSSQSSNDPTQPVDKLEPAGLHFVLFLGPAGSRLP